MLNARSTVVVLALSATCTAAWAQYPGGGAGGARGGMRPDTTRSVPAEAPLSPGALVQMQLDQLEDDLKLGPAQRGAWNAYADRVQKLADSAARSRFEARTAMADATSAPAQLDQIAGAAHSRMAAIDEIVELGRALYAMLAPEQKAIADPRLALPLSLLVTGIAPATTVDLGSRGKRGRSP
jgi:hypothetical protein